MDASIAEIAGIIVITCPRCRNGKFVVDCEKIRGGFRFSCVCGFSKTYQPGAEATLTIKASKQSVKGVNLADAVLLDDYKSKIANFILRGKQPKVMKENSGAAPTEDDNHKIRDAINALCSLGMSEAEARKKVEIAIRDGMIRER